MAGTQTNYTATGNDAPSNDPTNPVTGVVTVADSPAAPVSAFHVPLPPATFASIPYNVGSGGPQPYSWLGDQLYDARTIPSRYTASWPWGNGAGRYAFGSGAPYGNPAGRNAPWYVTGANGDAGGYPNPSTILGAGRSQIPAGQPGAFTGWMGPGNFYGGGQPHVAVDQTFGGAPKPSGNAFTSGPGILSNNPSLTGAPSAPATPPPPGADAATAQGLGMILQPGTLPSGSAHYAINQAGGYRVGDINPRTGQAFTQFDVDSMNPGNAQMLAQFQNGDAATKSMIRYRFPTAFRNFISSGNASFADDAATQPGMGY